MTAKKTVKKTIEVYDTTLRDGSQCEDVNFSVEDKITVARALDELGIHYIEGGWPGSNPRDVEFFSRAKKLRLPNARLAAFGSTRRPGVQAAKDANLKALVESGAQVACIFGKSWDFHVTEALEISLEENLELIHDSVKYLKKHFEKVFFDAEHFFDGYRANPTFALNVLRSAHDAGADVLVLCDTNGGSLPTWVREVVTVVDEAVPGADLGIHAHNDTECGVANAVAAVEAGAVHVQGTINGIGERCGNANLVSIIPNLQLKLGCSIVTPKQLRSLRDVSRLVYELINMPPWKRQPYVGDSAFAHKGGIHVSAVQKSSRTYEHIEPGLVGNSHRILVSDLAGQSNVLYKAKQYGIDLTKGDPAARQILDQIKQLEHAGYQYEGAEASFELLMQRALHKENHKKGFRLVGFRVIDEKRAEGEEPVSEATVRIEVDGELSHSAAIGNGPVNALDGALRKSLIPFYPELKEIELVDYKVRVITGEKGTASVVRVLIESTDGRDRWGTVGVSHNIIEASYQALVDSLSYKLYKDRKRAKG